MFVHHVDRSATKNEIRDYLLYMAGEQEQLLSRAKADKLAVKFKKGLFDPDLVAVLGYSDPTGETAVRNEIKRLESLAA